MTKPVPMGVGKGSEDDRFDPKKRRACPLWNNLKQNKISKLADELARKQKEQRNA